MSELVDMLQIEPMDLEHLEQVLKIEKLSFPTPWSKEAYAGEIKRNRVAHYFVCLYEYEVIGYIGVWVIIDEAHITTIAVDPDYRGNRVAQKLIEFVIGYSKKWGAEKLALEVRESNYAAQNLYRKIGFKEIGVRKGYYRDLNEDAIVMIKRFSFCR